MEYTGKEVIGLEEAGDRIERLREFLVVRGSPSVAATADVWFEYLSSMKAILGNFSNDLSLVACLLAKSYLMKRFHLAPFDVAAKSQNARGVDIDVDTLTGDRIIGEIKTTTPTAPTRFGAQQISSLRKDFAKLQSQQAAHKFMFVTEPGSLDVIRRSHMAELAGVRVVCLCSGKEIGD